MEEDPSDCETTAVSEDVTGSDWDARVENEELSPVVDASVSDDPQDDSVTDCETKFVAEVDDSSSEYDDDWDETAFVDSSPDDRVLGYSDSENDVDGASGSEEAVLGTATDDENDSEVSSLEVSTVDELTGSEDEATAEEDDNSVVEEPSISEDEEGIGVVEGTWTI